MATQFPATPHGETNALSRHQRQTVTANTLPPLIRVRRRNAEAAFDGQVILYAPRDHELHGYFVSAILVDMQLDLVDTAFMFLELRNIEMFPTIVPTTNEGEPFELAGKDREGSLKWWAYSAGLRGLSDSERNAILAESGVSFGEAGAAGYVGIVGGLSDSGRAEYVLVRQRARKAWLRMDILSKHGPVCALTGTSHVSRNGLDSEVEVCHIIPLGHGGPDVASNLFPLSKTIHWGFDIGSVPTSNEGTIIPSPHADPKFKAKFGGLKRARFPKDPAYWPAVDALIQILENDESRAALIDRLRQAEPAVAAPVVEEAPPDLSMERLAARCSDERGCAAQSITGRSSQAPEPGEARYPRPFFHHHLRRNAQKPRSFLTGAFVD